MELLSPANTSTLEAALAAGADAVYFGLKRLNARAGALNFSQEELPEAVSRIHAAGAKAHLTVNIDLEPREVGLAARTLQCAAQAGVDAVIVRDAAVLALRPLFPTLEFHLSTQSGVSTSAGVRAARALGCDRVVLAREMTEEEIRRAAQEEGIAIEVFVQGAMCFCVSGRCLLSSWVGGRSGNRGACASPCRVAWKRGDVTANPMSMHDLCLIRRLAALQQMGVASLKIEGRLKSAAWVTKAVSLYRKALDAKVDTQPDPRRVGAGTEAAELGRYTGRELTEGYFSGQFAHLTGEAAGRTASGQTPATETPTAEPPAPPQITVSQDERGGLILAFSANGQSDNVRIPPQRVAKANRAIHLDEMLEGLLDGTAWQLACPDELAGLLLPRRCQAAVADALAAFQRRLARPDDDGTIRIPLPGEVQVALKATDDEPPCPANRLHLGDFFDRLRVNFSQIVILHRFSAQLPQRRLQLEIVLDAPCTGTQLETALAALPERLRERPAVIALPHVCYEADLPALRDLAAFCGRRPETMVVQINSWDTWQLAREAGLASFEAGPGMAVLNAAAAAFLRRNGCACVAVSPEIDRRKLEELCASCGTPLSLTIFGRPALMATRAELPKDFAPASNGQPSAPFRDGRGVALQASREGALTLLRPVNPFDWRRLSNVAVRVTHLVCDLCGSGDIAGDLAASGTDAFLFNYDRTLR